MRDRIIQRIVEMQRGKTGIYPYHVATAIRDEFDVSHTEARECVTEYIRKWEALEETK